MNLEDIKTLGDSMLCNQLKRCEDCPIFSKCESIISEPSKVFFQKRLEFIIVYNRKKKLKKLLK